MEGHLPQQPRVFIKDAGITQEFRATVLAAARKRGVSQSQFYVAATGAEAMRVLQEQSTEHDTVQRELSAALMSGSNQDDDPPTGALLGEPPRNAAVGSADERIALLRFVAMAFDMVFGPAEEIEIKKKKT